MSQICYTCGRDVPAVRETKTDALDRFEDLGRRYFGMPRDAALCRSCDEHVLMVGRTLWEEETAGYCPSCRKEIGGERVWMAGAGRAGTYRVQRGARA